MSERKEAARERRIFEGRVIFLDRDDINTDEIIPARYLNETAKADLKPHLFEDLEIPGFDRAAAAAGGVVVTRSNFGCGSSREHAVWALEVNGIEAVAASGFARIFRQNMFNGGLLPVELAPAHIEEIFRLFGRGGARAAVDVEECTFTVSGEGEERTYRFALSPFHRELIRAGGWVPFAARRYAEIR